MRTILPDILQGFSSCIHRSVFPGAPNEPQQSQWDLYRLRGSSIILQTNTAAGSSTLMLLTLHASWQSVQSLQTSFKMQLVWILEAFVWFMCCKWRIFQDLVSAPHQVLTSGDRVEADKRIKIRATAISFKISFHVQLHDSQKIRDVARRQSF